MKASLKKLNPRCEWGVEVIIEVTLSRKKYLVEILFVPPFFINNERRIIRVTRQKNQIDPKNIEYEKIVSYIESEWDNLLMIGKTNSYSI